MYLPRFATTDEEIPIPSDIYIILAKCKTQNQELPCNGDIDVLSFILPHLPEIPNCLVKSSVLIAVFDSVKDFLNVQ